MERSPFIATGGDWSRYNPTNKKVPIIISEWGFPTCFPIGTPACPATYPGAPYVVDELTQAKFLTRMALASAMVKIPFALWYDWRDDPGGRPGVPPWRPTSQNFGVLKPDTDVITHNVSWVPRLAYIAAVTMQSAVRDQPFVRRVEATLKPEASHTTAQLAQNHAYVAQPRDVFILSFGNASNLRYAAWTNTTGRSIDVEFPVSAAMACYAVTSFLGVQQTQNRCADASRSLSVSLSDEPLFILPAVDAVRL